MYSKDGVIIKEKEKKDLVISASKTCEMLIKYF